MGATTSSNATIPVADPGEGPAFIQQGEGTKYYPELMVHENVNVTMYPIKQLGQLRPRGAVFPVWEMTVKM